MWPFKSKKVKSVEHFSVDPEDEYRAYEKRKQDWIATNELNKKKDAANLGTTHLHFNGSYERYMELTSYKFNQAFNQAFKQGR